MKNNNKLPKGTGKEHLEKFGFAIVYDQDGMESVSYTSCCSGSRSDC